jgi:hypothetical protein
VGRLRQIAEAIGRRRKTEERKRLLLAEWQTRTVSLFIAQQAGLWMDMDKHGGKNPMVQQALELSLFPDDEDELAEMRGEPTGYVSDEEGRKIMRTKSAAQKGIPTNSVKSPPSTIEVDNDGNVVGVGLGVTPAGFTEEEFGDQATPGSFEAFMSMFGAGGALAPR